MAGGEGKLKAREFLFFTEDLALASLPPEFPRAERRLMWTILQLHYGEPTVHFELQPQVSRGIVELGLHFEGTPEANEAGALSLAAYTHELRAGLGPEWELEEWTASWRRLHRTFSFQALSASLGREVAAQFGQLLRLAQPIAVGEGLCQPVAAPATRPAPSRDVRRRRFARK